MEEKAIVIFHHVKKSQSFDIELPLDIPASELVLALNQGLELGIDTKDISQRYLKSTNPIALLKGNKTLAEYGIHNGSEIWYGR
ncbi:MAG: EsaB/YukD family protein [Ruminococcus sp.]|nr:EsaB/YukD family protein [Ruminococcus sp.]